MAFTCWLDQPSEIIARQFGADAGPDPWAGGIIQPAQFAPAIVRAGGTGRLVIRPMHWGYPAPRQSAETTAPGAMRWVSYVRNLQSPYWIGNLRHVGLRCLIPLTSFSLQSGEKGEHLHCHIEGRPVFAAAGIWRDLTDMPVFAMLVTDPCHALLPVEGGKGPSSMPAVLDAAAQEQWLRADWKEASALIKPYGKADLIVESLS
jgi:putative SOS response-associated peptidase YedK